MTVRTDERPSAQGAETTASVGPGRTLRWWRSWRVCLRLARRDAWRDRWRSALVVVLILAPVAVIAGIDVYGRTSQVAGTTAYHSLLGLGRVADASATAYSGPVTQSPDGGQAHSHGDVLPPPSAPTFPAGWTTVPQIDVTVTAAVGPRAWSVPLTIVDGGDPLGAGRYDVRAGRLASVPGEVSVSTGFAAASGVGVGGTLSVAAGADGPVQLRVVGVADPTDRVPSVESVQAGPGGLDLTGFTAEKEVRSWLVRAPHPVSWLDVRAANALGLFVQSRAVLTAPPAFCSAGQLCADSGPPPGGLPQSVSGAQDLARNGALYAMLAILGLLQVALLAGPAFAVSLRRRQRDLALVAANGGTAADLRRSILSSAVVLGTVAGMTGVVAGIAFVAAMGSYGVEVPMPAPVVRPELLAIAAVGVVSALAAAAVPARIAGKTDVLRALHGRRPSGPVRPALTVAGAALGVLGCGFVWYGVESHAYDPVVLTAGILAGQVGVILLVPALVVAASRLGPRLGVTGRLAARDGSRSRLRTVSAVCAISAAAAGACAALVTTASYAAGAAAGYEPKAQHGTILVSADNASAAQLAATRSLIVATLPDAEVSDPAGIPSSAATTQPSVVVRQAGCPPRLIEGQVLTGDLQLGTDVTAPERCFGPGLSPDAMSRIVQADADWFATVTGVHDPAVAAVLSAGGAVVTSPALLSDGKITLVTVDFAGDEKVTASRTVPAVYVPTPFATAPLVVGARTSLPTGWVFTPSTIAVRPAPGSNLDDVETRLRAALLGTSDSSSNYSTVSVYVERGFVDDSQTLQIVAVGGTCLLALLAGLAVTALALADARPDLATMAAVGAPPRSRRRYAAWTAFFVAALGTWVGLVAGLVPAWALSQLTAIRYLTGSLQTAVLTAGDSFTIPWTRLLELAVVVPVLTAAAAGLLVRSRVPMTRRSD